MPARRLAVLAACLLAAGLRLAAPAAADPGDDAAAIRQRLALWAQAFGARDAAGACDLFAPDLVFGLPELPPGRPGADLRRFRAALPPDRRDAA